MLLPWFRRHDIERTLVDETDLLAVRQPSNVLEDRGRAAIRVQLGWDGTNSENSGRISSYQTAR